MPHMLSAETVYLVDADAKERATLTNLLRAEGYTVEVFLAGVEFLAAVKPDARGFALIDLHLRDMSGIDLVGRAKAAGVTLPMAILDGRNAVGAAVAAMKAGACDFIQRPFAGSGLVELVGAFIRHDREAAAAAAGRIALRRRYARLSPREREIIRQISLGRTSKEMARALGISPRTVEAHRSSIKLKLHARNTSEVARLALLASPETPDEAYIGARPVAHPLPTRPLPA